VISEVRKEVASAPWLKYKRERRVSDLPAHLDVADTDKVGRSTTCCARSLAFCPMNPALASKIGCRLRTSATLLWRNRHQRMFEECQLVNSIYADAASRIVEREEEIKLQLANARALCDASAKCEDKEQRRSAVLARNKAQSALWEHEQEARDQFSSLHLLCTTGAGQAGESQGLGAGDEHYRLKWHRLRSGSLPVLSAGDRRCLCGGNRRQRVRVRLPKTINGYVWFDDQQRAFLVERITNPDGPEGVKRVFLFQYKGKRT